MNINLSTVAVCAGLLLAYNGYVKGKTDPAPTPDTPVVVPTDGTTIKVVVPEGEVQVVPPADPSIAAASAGFKTALMSNPQFSPQDAAKLARTFVGWAELFNGNTDIKSTAQMQTILQNSVAMLLKRHSIATKQYALAAPINATIDAAIRSTGATETSTVWTPAVSQAVSQALNALAYQAWQAFIDGSVKPKVAKTWIESTRSLAMLTAESARTSTKSVKLVSDAITMICRKKIKPILLTKSFIANNAIGRCHLMI